MRNHHKRKLPPQGAVGNQILSPEVLERFLDHRQLMMTIQLTLAEPRKMLPAPKNLCVLEPCQEFPRISHARVRISRNHSRPHDWARRFKCQIEYWSEIDIESQRAAVLPNDLSVLAKQLGIVDRKHIRRRRSSA